MALAEINIIKFTRTDCGPCRMLEKLLSGVEAELPPGVKLIGVNADGEAEKCLEYGVSAVPAILFVANGETLRHLFGVVSREKFFQTLASALAEAGK